MKPSYALIDISMPLGSFTFDQAQKVEIQGPFNRVPGNNPEFVYDLKLCTQSDTHIQGPHYFLKDGKRIDEFPLTAFEAEATVIDMPKRGEDMSLDELKALVDQLDLSDKALLFRTGHMQDLINGLPLESKTRPGLSIEAAKYLVTEKKIRMIGIDSVGVESRVTQNYEANVYLCQNEILILEGLVNLDQITEPWVWLEAFPLKIKGVEGTPCRAVLKLPLTTDPLIAGCH